MVILMMRMIDLGLCLHHQRYKEQISYPNLHLNLSFSSKVSVKDAFNNTVQINISFFSTNSSTEIGLLCSPLSQQLVVRLLKKTKWSKYIFTIDSCYDYTCHSYCVCVFCSTAKF
mmetsp:Transcript_16869/g.35471  ORF Transcript_16869/g.35471 Transcript_16869/m.35471 type:complete len:115 (+) Transcript_16869:85-429(+)